MKRVFLRGSVRELQAATVGQMIGAGMMARITAVDANPYFFELMLAHEGQSRGSVVGLGARVKEWTRRVIRALAHAFNPSGRVPPRIYDGLINWHGAEDSRLPVGEIIWSRVAELNGLDHAQAIGWIYPDQGDVRTAINHGERDCCSIEADVVLVQEGTRLIVEDVERAVGVVLGHSSKQMPGFPGAIVRRIEEFGPTEEQTGAEGRSGQSGEAAQAGAQASSQAAAGAESGPQPAAPATPPTVAAPVQPAAPPDRATVVQLARQHGLTAAELGSLPPGQPPAQPPVAAPPAQSEIPAAENPDLTDAKWNPFLPE